MTGRKPWEAVTLSMSDFRRSTSQTGTSISPHAEIESSLVVEAADGLEKFLVTIWRRRTPMEKCRSCQSSEAGTKGFGWHVDQCSRALGDSTTGHGGIGG